MDKLSLFLNSQAVLFHDELDKRNGWETVAFNWQDKKYVKINPKGYKILRVIDEHPSISPAEIASQLNLAQTEVVDFVKEAVKEYIIEIK